MTRARLARLALVLALFAGPGVLADDEQAPQVEEQVTVRAAAPAPEDTAAFATTVDAERLEAGTRDLADVLRAVPGARVRSYGGIGQYATISLRGSTAEQVAVLLDGVPLNRALGGPVDLSLLPVSQIDRVTVFRGFAPVASGVTTLGGLVDVRSRLPGNATDWSVDLSRGSLSTTRAVLGWSAPVGPRTGMRIGLERLTTDGDFRFLDTRGTFETTADDDPDAIRINNDVTARTAVVSLIHRVAPGGLLTLHLRSTDRERGVPGLDSHPARRARLDESLDAGSMSWAWRRAGDATRGLTGVDLLADLSSHDMRLDDPLGELGVGIQRETTAIDTGGVGLVLRARAGGHRALARLDWRRERARVRNDALAPAFADRGGATRRLLAVAVEDVVSSGAWTIAPSLRWERRDDRFLAGAGGLLGPPADAVVEQALSGKLALRRDLGSRLALRGSAGRFYRAPNLLELFGDRGAVIGNPALRAESGVRIELGVAGDTGARPGRARLSGELALFGSTIDDLIVFQLNSQSTAVPRNVGRARILGLEASLRLVAGRLTLDASGTLQRAEDRSGGVFDGARLVGRPERLGALAATWNAPRWSARWDVTYVGENPADPFDTPAFRVPARVLHDASMTARLGRRLRLSFEVQNVFDRRTVDVLRFPLPGRLLFARLRIVPGAER